MRDIVMLLFLVLLPSCKRAEPPSTVDAAAPTRVADAAPNRVAPVVDAGAPDLAVRSVAPVSDGGTTQAFDGRPGWLVIADGSDRHARALARARELRGLGEPATVVQTSLLANLRPNLYIVVLGRFDDRAGADARLAALRAVVPKAYVKQSGPIADAPPDAGVVPLDRLKHFVGSAKHEEDRSPKLTIVTPDGTFITRPDADGFYEFWAAIPGLLHVDMSGHEKQLPPVCSRPSARAYWSGRDSVDGELKTADPSGAAERLDPLERLIESNACD